MSDSVRPHRRQPTRLLCPWDSPGKNTGVGCHFLLQCMKVKSESEVAQSCPTLSDPTDCNLPGFSVHGIFQARVLEWGAIAFSVPRCYSLKYKTVLLLSMCTFCLRCVLWVESCVVPHILLLKSEYLGPQNVTVFTERAFNWVVKVK